MIRAKIIFWIFFVGLVLIFLIAAQGFSENEMFNQKQKQMVSRQIEARGVKDKRVLGALLKVKRHLFVPDNVQNFAYEDYPLPIGEGQTISQPYIVGLMTELLCLDGSEKVLEIGTGSGYQAAVLGELSKEVYSIEIVEPLALRAQKTLQELGYQNIFVKKGDGFLGWEEHAPYDAIIVTCAPKEIPEALVDQLAEGGRLVIPVGNFFQQLKVVEKISGQVIVKDIIAVQFVPMVHEKESAP